VRARGREVKTFDLTLRGGPYRLDLAHRSALAWRREALVTRFSTILGSHGRVRRAAAPVGRGG
jgi:hypothetical protein